MYIRNPNINTDIIPINCRHSCTFFCRIVLTYNNCDPLEILARIIIFNVCQVAKAKPVICSLISHNFFAVFSESDARET